METINARFDWAMGFLAVAEASSFTAAAERLACSKAVLSKQVGQLEAALGVQLLFRTTRRLTLTEAGRTYLAYCRELRATFDEAGRTVSGLSETVSGLVRMTAPPTFGSTFMAELLLAFRERYPAVDVELELSREPRDLIADGFDLAIRQGRTLDERLIAKPIGVQEDWLVASPDCLAHHGMPCVPGDLAGRPCLVNSHFKDDASWLFLAGDASGGEGARVPVSAAFSVNDYPMIRRLALAGGGYARLPRFLVEADVAAGSLVHVLPGYLLAHLPLFLVFPVRRPQPPKVRALIDFVDDWFRARPG
ncbi:LysR family transcriptional regulator [Crenobacter cavernae]|uniref:LysR family transcriptional regulator n=1 Tax=Crenobacter cavernae TaxID=2290923 RepID=A0ABY0FA55_9NEIS|nr:LysR family transcriptional regulator [Crenobacter cavernae]RXZ42147.1 LysR family transcriptional regulator [Crenobacter cavernae]